jgi:hypothetical protein
MSDYCPFPPVYWRALRAGNTKALQKLVSHAMRAKSQRELFVGDDLTIYEELATAA